jgi:hypothetical protein
MHYRKINVEIIVLADEAEALAEELTSTLDQLDERYTIFGGGIDTVAVEHRGTRKKSAFTHTKAAGETAAGAVKLAGEKVAGALRHII